MTIILGCIADDYTGASDLANTLNKNGLRTIQTIGVPGDDISLNEIDAVVVALKTRSIAADEAVTAALRANAWLRAKGAAHIMFKICSTFDSTDAGNIGPVTIALREASKAQSVLVTPAFPETGRLVFQGYLFVNGVPLHESPLKDHPLNPMRDSNLVRVMTGQTPDARIGLIDEAIVRQGAGAIRRQQSELVRKGCHIAIIDAISEINLEAIGRAAFDQAVSVGASGLGLGLARAIVAAGHAHHKSGVDVREPVGGHSLCIVGSCSKASLEQIAYAELHMPTLRLDPEALLRDDAETNRAIAWAMDRLPVGPVLIASSQTADEVTALQQRYGRENAGHLIEQAMATITARLVEKNVRRLVIGGGETSGAVTDRLGITAFELGAEIAPGVPVLHSVHQQRGHMLLALKSGNFGGEDFFTRALALMT